MFLLIVSSFKPLEKLSMFLLLVAVSVAYVVVFYVTPIPTLIRVGF